MGNLETSFDINRETLTACINKVAVSGLNETTVGVDEIEKDGLNKVTFNISLKSVDVTVERVITAGESVIVIISCAIEEVTFAA